VVKCEVKSPISTHSALLASDPTRGDVSFVSSVMNDMPSRVAINIGVDADEADFGDFDFLSPP